MSESTLSISYTDLLKAIKAFLGYAVNTDENNVEVDGYVQAGIRNFYYPHAVEGVDPSFEWSFLKPTTTLATVASTSDYDLPDDLGRIADSLYFEPEIYVPAAIIVSEAEILAHQQYSDDEGTPRIGCVRFKTSTGDDGQRQELVLWPTPDDAYTLTYRYEAYAGKLTTALPYPLGGMKLSELVVESCLAVAEQRQNDEKGLHTDNFARMLVAAVKRDGRNGAHNFGNMGGGLSEPYPLRHRNGDVTYKGDTW